MIQKEKKIQCGKSLKTTPGRFEPAAISFVVFCVQMIKFMKTKSLMTQGHPSVYNFEDCIGCPAPIELRLTPLEITSHNRGLSGFQHRFLRGLTANWCWTARNDMVIASLRTKSAFGPELTCTELVPKVRSLPCLS